MLPVDNPVRFSPVTYSPPLEDASSQVANGGSEKHLPALKAQERLIGQLFNKMRLRQHLKLVLYLINPDRCQVMSVICGVVLLAQLCFSRKSRQVAFALSRFLGVSSSLVGFCAGVALVALHKRAEELCEVEVDKTK